MYEDGEGVKHSYVLAAKWYRKAGEQSGTTLFVRAWSSERLRSGIYVVSPVCWRSIEVRPAHVQPIFCGSTNDRGGS
jgi:hypothetical protein